MAIGHIGWNGLGSIAGYWTKIDCSHRDVHLGEGRSKAVDCVGRGLGCIAKIRGHSFGAIHAIWRESVRRS